MARLETFFERLSVVKVALRERMRLCTQFLKDKVVTNISRPVTKTVVIRTHDTSQTWMGKDTKFGGPVGSQYTRVTDRSKPGEYPKADTTLLMTSIFDDQVEVGKDVWEGYLGFPVDYGITLELRMDRRFLTRTLMENMVTVERFFQGPIR